MRKAGEPRSRADGLDPASPVPSRAPDDADDPGAGRDRWRFDPRGTTSLLPWAVLAAAMVASVGRMVLGHWTPVRDNAMITSFALDVPGHPPLVGMPSSLSGVTGDAVSHPGPLPFWLLAPTTHLFGAPGYGVAIGVLLINLAMVALLALLVGRLPTAGAWLVTAVTPVLVFFGLGAGGMTAPFNPNFVVLSLFTGLVAAWLVGSGDPVGLPCFTVAASVAAQAHLIALPTVAILVVTVMIFTVHQWRRSSAEHERRVRLRRWILGASALGLVCWSGPIIDQAVGDGNLWSLVGQSGSRDGAGLRHGFGQLLAGVGLPPRWTTVLQAGPQPGPTVAQVVTGSIVLATLVAGAVEGGRRRNRALTAGAVVALVAAIAAAYTASKIPDRAPTNLAPANKTPWWPVTAFVWIAAGTVVIERVRLHRSTPAADRAPGAAPPKRTIGLATVPVRHRAVLLGLATLVAAVSGGALVADAHAEDEPTSSQFGQAQVAGAEVSRATAPGSTIRLTATFADAEGTASVASLMAQLRLRGHRVEVEVDDYFGYWTRFHAAHPTGAEAPDAIVFIRGPKGPAPPRGYRLVVRYDPADPPPAFEGFDQAGFGGIGRKPVEFWIFETAG